MKFKSLFATLAVAISMLFAACGETPTIGVGGGDDKKVTFDITVTDITSSGATVNVLPSDETVLYYFDKIAKSTYETYANDGEFTKAMIDALRSYTQTSGGSLVSALSVGESEHIYSNELAPNTEYYIFAFTVDAKLNPTSAATLKPFTTENVKMSSNTFVVSVKGGEITVTPSNNDTYFWSVEPSDIYDGKSDEFIMNDLIAYYDSEGILEYYLASGVSSFDYTTLLSSGESYTVYAFGYEGTPTTGLTSYTFTYGEGGSSGGGSGYATTSLTGDVNVEIAEVYAYYYGDYYGIGTNNWEIGFFSGDNTECIGIESFTALNQLTPEGNYTIMGDASEPNTAFSGAFDGDDILPAYYVEMNPSTGEIYEYALIESGTFSIAKDGSNYSVTLNLADVLGHKVTGSFNGSIAVAQGEVSSQALAVNGRSARSALRRFSSAASIRPVAVKSLKSARVK